MSDNVIISQAKDRDHIVSLIQLALSLVNYLACGTILFFVVTDLFKEKLVTVYGVGDLVYILFVLLDVLTGDY